MGFLANTFNKSLFTVDSYKSAIGDEKNNGYAVIKIIPDNMRSLSKDFDLGIIGIIQNPIKFNVTAEWEQMGGITGLLPRLPIGIQTLGKGINSLANVGGFADLGSVYASRKIYKKSGYLDITADLKIVNWNDDGSPYKSVILISTLLLPDSTMGREGLSIAKKYIEEESIKIAGALKRGYDVTKSGIIEGMNQIDKITGKPNNFLPATHYKELTEGVINFMEQTADRMGAKIGDSVKNFTNSTIGQQLIKNTMEELEDYVTLRSSPSTVTVEVGNFFKKRDMILTDASFEFSKEMTKSGPLYVDVHLTISSRKILGDVTDLGVGLNLSNGEGSGRVYTTY